MGYEKEAYLYWLFHYTGRKDFQDSTPNAYVWARPDVTFWAVGYHTQHPPPLESQLAFLIYLRNKETQQTLRVLVNIQYDASF